jgi:hypothetical protein
MLTARRCIAAALTLGLAGCLGPGTPPASTLNVSDDKVFQPVLRGAAHFPESRAAPSDPHTGHAVEFGFTRGSGSSSQTLASNYAYFGGTQFNAPATLTSDFTLTYVDMAYRFRAVDVDTGLGFEALAGVAFAEFDLSVSSAGRRASETLSSPGPQLGLGAMWRLRPGTSVQLRGTWFRSTDDTEVSHASRYDVALVQSLGRNAALRAGYSWWSLDSDRGETVSPIRVEFRGPTLGLELMF